MTPELQSIQGKVKEFLENVKVFDNVGIPDTPASAFKRLVDVLTRALTHVSPHLQDIEFNPISFIVKSVLKVLATAISTGSGVPVVPVIIILMYAYSVASKQLNAELETLTQHVYEELAAETWKDAQCDHRVLTEYNSTTKKPLAVKAKCSRMIMEMCNKDRANFMKHYHEGKLMDYLQQHLENCASHISKSPLSTSHTKIHHDSFSST